MAFQPVSTTGHVVPHDKTPVFVDCRSNQLYFVDKDQLDKQVDKLLASLSPEVKGGDLAAFLKAIQGKDVGNEFYRVNPSYLLTGVMALELRPGAVGDAMENLENPNTRFQKLLNGLDSTNQYLAFLVRDDGFAVFRKARQVAATRGFDTHWELLGAEEPIKFGNGGLVHVN